MSEEIFEAHLLESVRKDVTCASGGGGPVWRLGSLTELVVTLCQIFGSEDAVSVRNSCRDYLQQRCDARDLQHAELAGLDDLRLCLQRDGVVPYDASNAFSRQALQGASVCGENGNNVICR